MLTKQILYVYIMYALRIYGCYVVSKSTEAAASLVPPMIVIQMVLIINVVMHVKVIIRKRIWGGTRR